MGTSITYSPAQFILDQHASAPVSTAVDAPIYIMPNVTLNNVQGGASDGAGYSNTFFYVPTSVTVKLGSGDTGDLVFDGTSKSVLGVSFSFQSNGHGGQILETPNLDGSIGLSVTSDQSQIVAILNSSPGSSELGNVSWVEYILRSIEYVNHDPSASSSSTISVTIGSDSGDASGRYLGPLTNNGTSLTVALTPDATAPAVASVQLPVSSGILHIGDSTTFVITLDDPVTIDTTHGAPTLKLNDGGTATFDAADSSVGSTSSTLVFHYTVGASDQDVAKLTATSFNLNGAVIQNSSGLAASDTSLTGFTQAGPQVDIGPVVSEGVAGPSSGDFGVGKVITLYLEMNQAVTVTGTGATLTLSNGGTATLDATNTAALQKLGLVAFDYTVAPGDHDAATLGVASVNLNGTTIFNGVGSAAVFLDPLPSFADISIDTTAPVLSFDDQTLLRSSASGAAATFATTATDGIDGTDPVVFHEGSTVVHSGDTFSVGQHIILATSTDAAGNTAYDTFTVVVTLPPDVTAPVLTPIADQTVMRSSNAGATVMFSATATDDVDGTDPVVFHEGNAVVHSGDTFSAGQHVIVATSTDAAGNTAYDSFTVTVLGSATWSKAVSGSFDDGANWSIGAVPDGGFVDAAITKAGAYTVTQTVDHAINKLTVGNASSDGATLDIHGATLQVGGGVIANHGTIEIDGSSSLTQVEIGGNTRLTGGGEIDLVGQAHIETTHPTDGTYTLTNVDNTISGIGSIGDDQMSFINYGTVTPSSDGSSLAVEAFSTRNVGVLHAADAAALFVFGALDNIGTIDASGGSIYLAGTVINKGAIEANPGAWTSTIHAAGTVNNHGGTIDDNDGYVFIQSLTGGGGASIRGGGLIEFGSNSNAHVTFGDTGTLALDLSLAFRGSVSGFGANDTFRFNDIASAGSTVKYVADAADPDAGGRLKVFDASHALVANIAMAGDYTTADFVKADDGHGHLLIQASGLLV